MPNASLALVSDAEIAPRSPCADRAPARPRAWELPLAQTGLSWLDRDGRLARHPRALLGAVAREEGACVIYALGEPAEEAVA